MFDIKIAKYFARFMCIVHIFHLILNFILQILIWVIKLISNKKLIWLILLLTAAIAIAIAINASGSDENTSSPRGVFVKRIDYYGC